MEIIKQIPDRRSCSGTHIEECNLSSSVFTTTNRRHCKECMLSVNTSNPDKVRADQMGMKYQSSY